MKYHRLISAEGDGLVCTEFDLFEFDPRRFDNGVPVFDWDPRITLWYQKGEPEDYLTNMLYWPVISNRLRSVLENLRIAGVQFFPVQVRNRTSQEPLNGYSVVNILRRVAALDLDRAEYLVHQVRGITAYSVMRWVLRREVLEPYDMIRLSEVGVTIVVSDRIKVAIEMQGFTGCSFREVSLS